MTIQSTVGVAIVESENVIVVRQLVRHQRMDADSAALCHLLHFHVFSIFPPAGRNPETEIFAFIVNTGFQSKKVSVRGPSFVGCIL